MRQPRTSASLDLDIVMPVYNEGETIVGTLNSLTVARSRLRVIICYDRDDDNTLPVIARHSWPFPVVPVRNCGQGVLGAVRTGFAYSEAPAVLVMPADDDFNSSLIDGMVDAIRKGADIVAPSRFMQGGRMIGCPFLKGVLVRTAAFTLRHIARLPTHDATNGFRSFSRRVIDQIEIESTVGFTYGMELLVKCHRLGWPVVEVPAEWRERLRGNSRFRTIRWSPAYLRWYLYAMRTTFLRRGPNTVKLKLLEPALTS